MFPSEPVATSHGDARERVLHTVDENRRCYQMNQNVPKPSGSIAKISSNCSGTERSNDTEATMGDVDSPLTLYPLALYPLFNASQIATNASWPCERPADPVARFLENLCEEGPHSMSTLENEQVCSPPTKTTSTLDPRKRKVSEIAQL